VFVATSALGAQYQRGLQRLAIAYDHYRAGNFVVYQPDENVPFEQVLAAGAAP
jgi:hypothetical protein